MNENIDLTKILKNCPKGYKFYSLLYGEVEFISIDSKNGYYQIVLREQKYYSVTFVDSKGKYFHERDGECTLFPSKDQRDWSKFAAPWYNSEKHGKEEYGLKSSKDEYVSKFMQYIKKQAKAYEFNLSNIDYDIYAFAKDLLVWLEKQGEQEEPQVYETEDGNIITYSETDGYKFYQKNRSLDYDNRRST